MGNDPSVPCPKYIKTILHNGNITDGIREVNIMKAINHPNIMPCESADINDALIILSMPKGVSDMVSTNLAHDDKLRVFYSIACAVRFLHQNNILHCDIKPGNIILFQINQ